MNIQRKSKIKNPNIKKTIIHIVNFSPVAQKTVNRSEIKAYHSNIPMCYRGPGGQSRFSRCCFPPFQNGYPARRRSLVDDAKFETSVNRESRQEWLSHIRQSLDGTYELTLPIAHLSMF